MARTRAAEDNGAYRDAPASRAVPRAPAGGTRGGPRSSDDGRSRHAFGVFSVVAVFALVGVTLWRPLAVLVALPVIVVLALVVRAAVPVPAPARAATGPRQRQPRNAPVRPERDVPARDARPRPARRDDRPPYDQESDRRVPPARTRRPAPSTPPMPADRYQQAGPYEPDEATEQYRIGEPRQSRHRQPAPPAAVARHDDRRRPDARAYPDDPDAGFDPSAPGRAGVADGGAFAPPPRGQREAGQRHGGSSAGYDRADDAGRYAGQAAPGRGTDDHHTDDRRREAEERYGAAPGGRDEAPGARYPDQPPRVDGRGQAEWRRAHGDDHAEGYQDGHGPDGYDEYSDHGRAEDEPGYGREPGRGPAGAAGDRRRRGWRHQVWDDEGWDDTPEPEPDEDMMHTMSIDMRGYLDDTGSFRMP
ncbi:MULTISPECIES: hypothetical protein [unclassified Pseudofrankia]|uniref:hypothetical protein n=1 Tax=unclassified Pseudofrankia TaxID=2994372 RepID=UPI0008D9EF2D|nr:MULTISPECIES: hypothetical protein [unclassified Pseudofrankia]MDT3443052.1 hypothetical protein [Pseudofrankia sp. BMG5.37]OHV62211.1 hypothetical protein BCD48_39565 [Pseudofrankia sp. BMG5.36]